MKIDYTMVIVIILILLSTIVISLFMKTIVLFFLMTIIVDYYVKNIYKSVSISFFASLLFYLSRTSNTYEGFEDEINVDNLVKELTNLTKIDGDKTNDGTKDEIKDEDINLLDQDDNIPTEGNKYIEASKAQRETFRLINTIKQLEETVSGLAPTLKQGADIIEKFKKLNLIAQ